MRKTQLLGLLMFLAAIFLAASCGSNTFESVADDDSVEACQYEVSQALDEKDYQDVLDAECATDADRGAAYLGLAGFDINDIVANLVDANDLDDDQQVETYLSALVGEVSTEKMDYLKSAIDAYTAATGVSATASSASAELGTAAVDEDALEADSSFYLNVVAKPMYGLSALMGIIDPDGDGAISDCDQNNNDSPDEADAVACAFLNSASLSCTSVGATASPTSTPLTFTEYPGESFTGIGVTITGTATAACSGSYRHLMATDAGGNYIVTTTREQCTGSNSLTYNCPYIVDGDPVDVIDVIDDVLDSAVSFLATIVDDTTESEIYEAIDELRTDVCGADGDCTTQDVANYVQKLGI